MSLKDWVREEWLGRHPGHKGKLPTLKAMSQDNLQAAEEQREREKREWRERLEGIERTHRRLQEAHHDMRQRMCRFGVAAAYDELLQVLDLTPPVTRDEIKTAYRDLAKLHHPDRGGDVDEFRRIESAYRAVLEFTANYSLLNR
jgi:hypothetical protein